MQGIIDTVVLEPGAVISVPKFGFKHLGVVTSEGTVIVNSRAHKLVVEISMKEFAAGKIVQDEGYWGKLPPWTVEARARSMLGRRYNLLNFNCEHFVRVAHGHDPISKQVGWAALAGVAIIIFAMNART